MKPYEKVMGISCKQVVDYCMDYLSGTLPKEETASFDSHLTYCPECVRFFQTYRRTPEITRDALSLSMPTEVRGAVHNFLRSRFEKLP